MTNTQFWKYVMPIGLEPETNMGKAGMTKWNRDQQMNTIACQTQAKIQKKIHMLEKTY